MDKKNHEVELVTYGVDITSKEIDRRLKIISEKEIGLQFDDLICNQVIIDMPQSQFVSWSSGFHGWYGTMDLIAVSAWKNEDTKLTVKNIRARKNQQTDFKSLFVELADIDDKLTGEFHSSVGDYSLEDEETLNLRIGSGENRSFLKVYYPGDLGQNGRLEVILNPVNKNLPSDIRSIERAIKLLSDKELLPFLDHVNIHFQDILDKSTIFKKLELLRSHMPEYKKFFEKDLNVVKNLRATEGYYRAIIYFLGSNLGLILLQNTDLIDGEAVQAHSEILDSWLGDTQRSKYLTGTGFASDDMESFMHTFVTIDDAGGVRWSIDQQGEYPSWFINGKHDLQSMLHYLHTNYGLKNNLNEITSETSKRLALDGGLRKHILDKAVILEKKYGKNTATKYLKLARKFRLNESEPFLAGWEELVTLESLVND